jgi:hypothetical protein
VRPRVARRAAAAPDRSRLTTAPLGTSRSRSRGRLPGEHQVLGGRAARLQGPRAERAPPGDRRRHARHVGRAVRRVPGRAQTDVLGAQDRAGVGRAAEAAATRAKGMLHEIMEAPSRGNARQALERFGSEFDAKYPKAGANLDRDWAALTAFGRALAAPADLQRDREQLRYGQSPHPRHQGRRIQEGRARDGLQAAACRPAALTAAQRP